ncbi:MAG: hypothetical protein ACRENE_23620 [Polyangiaceae bacterium]
MKLRASVQTAVVAATLLTCLACGKAPSRGFGSEDGSDSGAAFDASGSGGSGGAVDAGLNLFRPDGALLEGGLTPSGDCDVTCAAARGVCVHGACTIDENPGSLSIANQTALHASGNADAGFLWRYPYDRTVFPRGLLAPTFQFGGGASDGELVRITAPQLDYTGYFGGRASGQVRLTMSQAAWDAVVAAVGPADKVTVAVTKISGKSVTGPATESWTVAPGSVRGTLYYETYGSGIIGGNGGIGIMKLQPGATKPTPLKAGCGNVCHTASSDGTTLVAATASGYSGGASASYGLVNGTLTTLASLPNMLFTFGGLYVDGSFSISATNFRDPTNTTSRLYDTKTGANIPNASWDSAVTKAGTIGFSPDGKRVAFVHEDEDQGHSLAKMDYASSTKTFSGLVDLATDSSRFLGWPAFTPDSGSVLYQAGSSNLFETDCQNAGDLYIVDVATHTSHRLDLLDGYTGSGTASYLPDDDPDLSFAPTMLGEAVGGYFWVVFTSHRAYGNLVASKANSSGLQLGSCVNVLGDEADGKLWVAAIDMNAQPGTDPSHPAFYVDGQELAADNLRAFWVPSPCEADGDGCTAGDQCCSGFCRGSSGTQTCVEKPPTACSNEYENCASAADCCMGTEVCINGRCSRPATPIQ